MQLNQRVEVFMYGKWIPAKVTATSVRSDRIGVELLDNTVPHPMVPRNVQGKRVRVAGAEIGV